MNNYFNKYLEVAPFAHALWRSVEAELIYKTYKEYYTTKLNNKFNNSNIFERPVLDLGCGFGEFAGVFFDRQVEIGIDVSINDLIKAHRKKIYKKLLIADARKLPFKNNSFSTVISISVLEHIPSVDKVIHEVYRVLKPGGIFLYTVPTIELNNNLFYPEIFNKLGMKRLSTFYLNFYHKVFKHAVIIPKSKWLEMSRNAGFIIILSQGMFPKKMTRAFDLFLITAFPSQIGRWLVGDRWVFALGLKKLILPVLYKYLTSNAKLVDSNILVMAKK